MGAPKINADAFTEEVIRTLKESLVDVIQIQSGVILEEVPITTRTPKPARAFGSRIRLQGSHYDDELVLMISGELILHLFSQILGEEVTDYSEEVQGLPLELANMVFGQTKEKLNPRHGLKMARPVALSSEVWPELKETLFHHARFVSQKGSLLMSIHRGGRL